MSRDILDTNVLLYADDPDAGGSAETWPARSSETRSARAAP